MSTAAQLSEHEYLAAERARDSLVVARKARELSSRQRSFQCAVDWLDAHLMSEIVAAASVAAPHVVVTCSNNFAEEGREAFKPPALTVSASRVGMDPRVYEFCVKHGLISTVEHTKSGRRAFAVRHAPGPHLINQADRMLARAIAHHIVGNT